MAETYNKDEMIRRMKGAVAGLKGEFAGLRTGRASPALLDPVTIEAYGNQMHVSQLGTISTPEPRLLTVQVWDRSMVKAVDKAIREFQSELAKKGVSLEASEACRELLAAKGYSKDFGAREVERIVADKIKNFFVDEILFGKLAKGGKVLADAKDGEVSLTVKD